MFHYKVKQLLYLYRDPVITDDDVNFGHQQQLLLRQQNIQ